MHLILFLPKEVYSLDELSELRLPVDNPHGRLHVNRTDYLSITHDELTQPEYFQSGTLYAYVAVQGVNDEDPRATLRVKGESLYLTLGSLVSKLSYLYSKGVLHVQGSLPAELSRL